MKEIEGINIIIYGIRIKIRMLDDKNNKNIVINNTINTDSFKRDRAYCFLVRSGVLNKLISSNIDNIKFFTFCMYLFPLFVAYLV